MTNASVAIQILPLDSEEKKTLEVVDQVIEYIQSCTDNYEVSAFETTIEGEYDQVMDILKEVIKIAGEAHPDIFSNVKIRYKGGEQVLSTDEKTQKFHQ
ncbi:MAG: thiamine-binding protein [Tetragenococcus halophilus]|nr:thiamine-binding protein [Tetragenococcus halophilus]